MNKLPPSYVPVPVILLRAAIILVPLPWIFILYLSVTGDLANALTGIFYCDPPSPVPIVAPPDRKPAPWTAREAIELLRPAFPRVVQLTDGSILPDRYEDRVRIVTTAYKPLRIYCTDCTDKRARVTMLTAMYTLLNSGTWRTSSVNMDGLSAAMGQVIAFRGMGAAYLVGSTGHIVSFSRDEMEEGEGFTLVVAVTDSE